LPHLGLETPVAKVQKLNSGKLGREKKNTASISMEVFESIGIFCSGTVGVNRAEYDALEWLSQIINSDKYYAAPQF